MEFDLSSGVAAGMISGLVGVIAWLGSKLWNLYRQEVKDMRTVDSNVSELLQQHIQEDQQFQHRLTNDFGEMKGYLKAIAEK